MTIIKTLNGDIDSAALTAPLPDRASREYWTISGTTIVVDQAAKGAADLSPDEFEYMLDLTGLDDAWTALEAILKSTNRTSYANLRAERRKTTFRLDYTLAQVALFRPTLSASGYDITSLTDANITARWGEVVALR